MLLFGLAMPPLLLLSHPQKEGESQVCFSDTYVEPNNSSLTILNVKESSPEVPVAWLRSRILMF